MSQTSIHSSSGTLSNLILWIYLSLPLYNHKGFDLCHICLWRRSPNQWTTVEVPSLQISLCLHTPHILISFNCPLSFFGLYHHLHYLFSSSHIFLLSSDNLFTIFANEKPNQKSGSRRITPWVLQFYFVEIYEYIYCMQFCKILKTYYSLIYETLCS